MTDYLHRAIMETLGNPACIGERSSHLVDHLLAFIGERCRQPANHRINHLGRHSGTLGKRLVGIDRVRRMPFAGEDAHYKFALTRTQRKVPRVEIPDERSHRFYKLRVAHPDLQRGAGERGAGLEPFSIDRWAIGLLLLRRVLVRANLGEASNGSAAPVTLLSCRLVAIFPALV